MAFLFSPISCSCKISITIALLIKLTFSDKFLLVELVAKTMEQPTRKYVSRPSDGSDRDEKVKGEENNESRSEVWNKRPTQPEKNQTGREN